MKNRVCTKTFRCTASESQELLLEAEKNHISESEYIRRQVFGKSKPRLPPSIEELLKKMNYLNLRIGTNINQTMRFCNSRKYITKTDYQNLVDELKALDEQYERIYELLEGALKHGSD